MSFSYLKKSTHIFFIFFIILILFNKLFFVFLALVLIYGILIYLFRRPMDTFRDTNIDGNDSSIFSPINGKVVSIEQVDSHPFFGNDLTCVHLSLPLFKDMGVYLPLTCEVVDKRSACGAKKNRASDTLVKFISKEFQNVSGISLLLQTTKKNKIGLSINQCLFGGYPQIAVSPGDRGLRQVNIGNISFGGSVFLYFSKEYETSLSIGSKVQTGRSIIASFTREKVNLNKV